MSDVPYDPKEILYYKLIVDCLEKEYPKVFKEIHEKTPIDFYRKEIGLEPFWYGKLTYLPLNSHLVTNNHIMNINRK